MSLMGALPGRSPRLIGILTVGCLAAALAACTSDVSLDEFNLSKKINNIKEATASTLSFQGGRDFSVRPVTQADLVGPQGQCAAAPFAGPTSEDGQPNAAPVVSGGVRIADD